MCLAAFLDPSATRSAAQLAVHKQEITECGSLSAGIRAGVWDRVKQQGSASTWSQVRILACVHSILLVSLYTDSDCS